VSASAGRAEEPFAGDAAERTEFAWMRTVLSCGGLAALSTRLIVGRADIGSVLAFAAVVVAPGLLASLWRMRELQRRPVPPPRRAGAAFVAGSVALVSAAVFVRVVTS
jgi:uncharacterized membrane protein YidH (DUF202 family)